jgi:predicted DCC family thiol-disulfide oxidoreductase YuxK
MKARLVLYDERCGACVALARRLERHGIALAPIGSSAGARWLRDLGERERYAAVHAIDAAGRRHTGGDAVPVVLAALPRGVPLARLARSRPRATERAYRILARHRRLVAAFCETTRASRARAG